MARTPRAVALGRALRQEREARGFSLREFAGMISRDEPTLSRWETGDRVPSAEQLGRVLGTLGVAEERFSGIMMLVRDAKAPSWVAFDETERQWQRRAYVDFEQEAAAITLISLLRIPDLLQTPTTIAAAQRARGVAERMIPEQVEAVVGRRERLTVGHEAPAVTAFIGDSAVRQSFGEPRAALAQLGHLVDMARRPNVSLRIVPSGFDAHPDLHAESTLLDCRQLRIVVTGCLPSPVWVHRPEHVRSYRGLADDLTAAALSEVDSIGFISHLAHWHRSRIGPLVPVRE
ncbi:helix-turn-helix transcriptional regulator [Actinokineospora auranticolor]|uniref:Transcriptional regulator with XRE-family HTH domain n=1 Tax=Actinokineospora auranticolor TaxID=155976 RepID=A0A2S6GN34_9PSEU|nr:helix-turn-helix transcriptional regulator [Actinokineospora auranticolor]PPK66541.1 transcriptional regulator with XRE-family HTH domain [Actinokineospora auranticolor]